jgi:hypothetical protein
VLLGKAEQLDMTKERGHVDQVLRQEVTWNKAAVDPAGLAIAGGSLESHESSHDISFN